MEEPFPYNDLFVPSGIDASGHLRTDGANSKLTLLSSTELEVARNVIADIHGTLKNGRKASLLECVKTGYVRHRYDENSTVVTSIFPHKIVLGEKHVNSSDECVKSIRYHFENIENIIHDMEMFGTISATRDDLLNLLQAGHERRCRILEEQGKDIRAFAPKLGDHPIVLFYDGVFEIMKCQCDLGTVSLTNRPSYGAGSAAGVAIKNAAIAEIEFAQPQTVEAALKHLFTLHKLFELCLGRPQRYLKIDFIHKDACERDLSYDIYWSGCNEHISGEANRPHLADVLLDPIRRPDEFTDVVSRWLDSDVCVGIARRRFSSYFGQNMYSVDRIIGVANMFDLLPKGKAPRKQTPDDQTTAAVTKCKKIFRCLPESFAREAVLSALGRVGAATLRDKVIYRANIIKKSQISDKFTEIDLPISQAVLCRNHFVHGSDASFNYFDRTTEFAFLTDTLEFVFAVSDLIELGWNFDKWQKNGPGYSHKFGFYVLNYDENLEMLKEIL